MIEVIEKELKRKSKNNEFPQLILSCCEYTNSPKFHYNDKSYDGAFWKQTFCLNLSKSF